MTHATQTVIAELDARIEKLEEAKRTLLELDGGEAAPVRRQMLAPRPTGAATRTRTPMSEESKAKMKAAQEARWAKVRAEKAGTTAQPATPTQGNLPTDTPQDNPTAEVEAPHSEPANPEGTEGSTAVTEIHRGRRRR